MNQSPSEGYEANSVLSYDFNCRQGFLFPRNADESEQTFSIEAESSSSLELTAGAKNGISIANGFPTENTKVYVYLKVVAKLTKSKTNFRDGNYLIAIAMGFLSDIDIFRGSLVVEYTNDKGVNVTATPLENIKVSPTKEVRVLRTLLESEYLGRVFSLKSEFKVSLNGDLSFAFSGSIAYGTQESAIVVRRLLENEVCPKIDILYSTDSYSGNNIAQVVMQEQSCCSQYLPHLQKCIVDLTNDACSNWSSKVLAIAIQHNYPNVDLLSNNLIACGLLKYFLWYLITKKWYLPIVSRRYDELFNSVVKDTKYECWLGFLNSSENSEVKKFYVY